MVKSYSWTVRGSTIVRPVGSRTFHHIPRSSMTVKNPKPPSDSLLEALELEHDTKSTALESKSYIVSVFCELSSNISGLTAKAFVPSILAATDCALGPDA